MMVLLSNWGSTIGFSDLAALDNVLALSRPEVVAGWCGIPQDGFGWIREPRQNSVSQLKLISGLGNSGRHDRWAAHRRGPERSLAAEVINEDQYAQPVYCGAGSGRGQIGLKL